MSKVVQVIVTRPAHDASGLIQKMRRDGLAVWHAPMMKIVFAAILQADMQRMLQVAAQDNLGILFTSGNAVRALSHGLGSQPDHVRTMLLRQDCCCVGAQTLAAAQRSGFRHCHVADGDVTSMLDLLLAQDRLARKHWFHPRAHHHRGDLVLRLQNYGITAQAFCAYTAQELLSLPREVEQILQDVPVVPKVAVMLYSPRTAVLWEKMLARYEFEAIRLQAYCLSPAVADALQQTWQKVAIASQRTSESLEKLLYNDWGLDLSD